MKYKHIGNVLATTKRTKGTLFALMIVGLATLLFLACPEPDTDSIDLGGITDDGGTVTDLWKVTFKTDDTTKTQTVRNGDTVSKPSEPTTGVPTVPAGKEDKISKYIVGWYTDEAALTTPFDFATTITKDITLYAAWAAEIKATKGADDKLEIPANHLKDDKTLTRVIIPNGVVKIGNKAFKNTSITSVIIPDGVKEIGNEAFKNTSITSVIIPDGVTEIGNEAFGGSKLTSVVIPNSVITLGHSVFAGNQLTKITISGGLKTITGSTFRNNQLTEVTIPKEVTLIEANAFAYNLLTKITWGANVERINQSAFADNKLTKVDIPDTVKQINATAFYKNPLTTVTIRADDVKFVGDDAFSTDGTSTLTKVVMTKKLYDDLKAIKAGRLAEIFTFKGATPKYEDPDGKELK